MNKMTEQMTIEWLESIVHEDFAPKTQLAILTVIKAAKERQQYRAIGTVEEVKYAILAKEELERRNKYLIPVRNKEREELEQYRKLGTIEELQALKEKSVAKKPNYEGDGYYGGQLVLDTWICPNCGKSYEVDYDDYEYCPNCGQHIDHSSLTEDD